MKSPNRDMLRIVAQGLGDLRARVVFLGGATVDLYVTDPGASEVRPTLDVDCIIEIASLQDVSELEDALRERGFAHDRSEGAPVCRWIYRDIKVDVMPTRPNILGFTNDWYEEGFRHSLRCSIGDGLDIRILEVPYFIATKLSAMQNRAIADLRTSKDFEDVVYLLRNRSSMTGEISKAEPRVRRYIAEVFMEMGSMEIIGEAVAAVLDYGEPPGTRQRILLTMQEISALL